jgi:hypothetical protein
VSGDEAQEQPSVGSAAVSQIASLMQNRLLILKHLPSLGEEVSLRTQTQRGVEGRVLSCGIESTCPRSHDPDV